MKLHKQTRLKTAVVALIAGLMLGFLGLIRTHPGIDAEVDAAASPSPNFDQFFAPERAATPAAGPVDRPPPHTRSRAS